MHLSDMVFIICAEKTQKNLYYLEKENIQHIE